MIEKQIKEKFGSWTAFANFHERNPKNFKRTFLQNIDKMNSWLKPLGLKVQICAVAKK